jgi:hypothetical protein
LDISLCESEELTRQCRKLIGTIPIVKAWLNQGKKRQSFLPTHQLFLCFS